MINKKRRRNTKASRRRKIAYWNRIRRPRPYEYAKWIIEFNERRNKRVWKTKKCNNNNSMTD